MSPEDDKCLVERSAMGDQVAFRILFDRHAPNVLRFLERILSDASLAEDVCQEAFVRLWRKAGSFQPERGTFSAWLFRTAANLAFNRLALRSSTEVQIENWDLRSNKNPEETVDAAVTHERSRLLHQALQRLSPGDRAIIVLRQLEDRSVAEVADLLGIPEGTVKSRLHYAMHRLRGLLEGVLAENETFPTRIMHDPG